MQFDYNPTTLLHKYDSLREPCELSLLSGWLHGSDLLLSWDASQGYSSRLRDPLPTADLWQEINNTYNLISQGITCIGIFELLLYPLYST